MNPSDTTRVRINLKEKSVEFEGSADFVLEQMKKYGHLIDNLVYSSDDIDGDEDPDQIVKPKEKAKKPKAKTSSKTNEGKLDKTLDLSGGGSKPSLKSFIAGYDAKTNMQRNIVFLSYLADILELTPINIDHIYTCYDDTGRIPGALKQSLYDTSASGYINCPALSDISLAVKGVNWLKDNEKNGKE